MIQYKHNNLVIPTKKDDILTLVTKNDANVIIRKFSQVIQDVASNNTYQTKSLDRCNNRELKIYKINTGYSIVTFTNCRQFLIVDSDDADKFCTKLSIEIAHGRMRRLRIRYGLCGEKILGIEIYNEDKPIAKLIGEYYTRKSAFQVGIYGNAYSEKFEYDFYEERDQYFKYIEKHLCEFIEMTKDYLPDKTALKIIAMKLTSSCGEAYGLLSTVIRLIANGYKSTLSEEKFRRAIHLLSHKDYIAKRKEIILKLKMEVTLDE